jgi:hypothetical protein
MPGMRFVVIVLAVTITASSAIAQTNPMRPGRWEVTMQMEMPGMPMAMPAMKNTRCVTQQEVDSPNRGDDDEDVREAAGRLHAVGPSHGAWPQAASTDQSRCSEALSARPIWPATDVLGCPPHFLCNV